MKMAPVPGAILSAAVGKDPVGQKTGIGREALRLVTPLAFGDVYDVMTSQGIPGGLSLSALALYGQRMNTWEKLGVSGAYVAMREQKQDAFGRALQKYLVEGREVKDFRKGIHTLLSSTGMPETQDERATLQKRMDQWLDHFKATGDTSRWFEAGATERAARKAAKEKRAKEREALAP